MSNLPVGFGSSGTYEIEKSLRLRSNASAYLSRTIGIGGANTKHAAYTAPNGTRYTRIPSELLDEISDPQPPEDYSEEIYFRTEQIEAPYVVYTRKSPEMIERQTDQRNFLEANKYLKDTDYAFTVDKYEQLSEERKIELKTAREAARVIIRNFEIKYSEEGMM